MKNEIELWTPLQNDGIVKLHYSTLSPVPLLVLESCDGGTLFGAIRRAHAPRSRRCCPDPRRCPRSRADPQRRAGWSFLPLVG